MRDALNQTKQYGYTVDNRLAGITYSDPLKTPNVSFADDPYFPRRVSMTDGTGTTQYSYVPVGTFGALKLQQEQSPLANSAIGYAYDALGRLSSRTVAGAGAEGFGYDALGRLDSHTDDLGAFTLSYLGQTGQIAERQQVGGSLFTAWSYLANSGDRRLSGIDNNIGTAPHNLYTAFAYATAADGSITATGQAADAGVTIGEPAAPLQQTASYNILNQLTNLSGQALGWDADGNLLSDATRSYTWDAENRLTGITLTSSGKTIAFAYDGLGRRTAITANGATTSYLWCGSRLCQARNSSNATTREYYAEGEFLPGSPPLAYYYGIDQIGSVRRVFATNSTAPAYDYDPYGNPLQATAPVTDFAYAGMFYQPDSGLYLTQYRAYDPTTGRWLSRDPIGEGSDPMGNLYQYVGANPVIRRDLAGLWQVTIAIGAGYGGVITFGYNSEQASIGVYAGAVEGAELTVNPSETAASAAGLSTAVTAAAAAGIGPISAELRVKSRSTLQVHQFKLKGLRILVRMRPAPWQISNQLVPRSHRKQLSPSEELLISQVAALTDSVKRRAPWDSDISTANHAFLNSIGVRRKSAFGLRKRSKLNRDGVFSCGDGH